MSDKGAVLYQEEKGIARIILNRPEALHAMNKELFQPLASLLDRVKADDGAKAAIITWRGHKAFSAGADIKFLNQASPLEVRELGQLAVTANHKIETLGKVVVAAVNGDALGGADWSWRKLACSAWLFGKRG
jgi:enoyl-CoA hydratase